MGICYLYVLPLAYEDILKLGISHDPFVRALAFSRRYYEFFDLSRSVLVELDSRKQAQARETALHRHLRDWNAMQPITVPRAAAGKREWYRGAYDTVLEQIERDEAGGRVVHRPALPWWQARLVAERERMYEWLAQVSRECTGGVARPDDRRRFGRLRCPRGVAARRAAARAARHVSIEGNHACADGVYLDANFVAVFRVRVATQRLPDVSREGGAECAQ